MHDALAAVPGVGLDAGPATATDAGVPGLILEPPGAEVMPPMPAPAAVHAPAVTLAPESWSTYAPPAPERTPDQLPVASPDSPPLAGLPYFDDTGHPHGAVQSPAPASSGEALPALGAAGALERVAGRIRAGSLLVPGLSAEAGEAETLAAVLASMLRDRR